MSVRPLLLAVAVGFAFATPAFAFDSDFDMIELAQATPPTTSAPGRTFSPKNMCLDMAARPLGARAYIKSPLALKPDQMTPWNPFDKASDEASAKSNARCTTLP